MASWMVHLRIADALMDKIPGIDETAFVVGNIAPDSGVPNADWTSYTPPKTVSHYHVLQKDGKTKKIDIDAFCAAYFSKERIKSYSAKEYSFFLGYFVHLLTDVEWTKKVLGPSKEKLAEQYTLNKRAFLEKSKEDWYDLDFRFLKEHPDFRAFRIYEQAEGFTNEYMKEFPIDAFENRRAYVCEFYQSDEHGELYRAYPYLNPEQADCFVKETADELYSKIQSYKGSSGGAVSTPD